MHFSRSIHWEKHRRSLKMKQILFAIIFILLGASSLPASQGVEWFKLAPMGGGFSVLMPAQPQEEVKTTDDFTMHLFTLTTEDDIYLASYGDYAPGLRIDVDEQLSASRESFARDLNARVIDSKKIKMDGRPGLEFAAVTDRAAIKSRIYLFGNRIHQVAVAALNGTTETDDVKRFFSSFAFTAAKSKP